MRFALDTETLEVVATIPLGKGKPNRIAFHPDGKAAWVVYDKSHDLGAVDVASHTQVRAIPVGKAQHGMALRPR